MPCPYLFVYGTLRQKTGTRAAEMLRRWAAPVANGHVRGRLYDLGSYPAMLPPRTQQDRVHGELVRLRNAGDALDRLDRFEGREYQRGMVIVRLPGGRNVRAWVYFYAGRQRGVRIASGDYLERGEPG